ncbi:ubiquitin-like domain-containing protein [Candidatus Saccharibacteria bacterium]|nr:ubiquitin-like domain-containing protein [Candidatus Saccharibacteria bacterium]
MKQPRTQHKFSMARSPWLVVVAALTFFVMIATTVAVVVATSSTVNADKQQYHVVTIYDDDAEQTIITTGGNVADVLKVANLSLGQHDSIEPALDQDLREAILIIKIHRARPIMVIDGQRQVRVITAAQNATEIAAAANIRLYPEDSAELLLTTGLSSSGTGLQLAITRAKVVNLRLYGQNLTVRTQENTVKEFLREKNIQLGSDDGMNLTLDAEISDGLRLQIWREGLQTVTTTEVIPFTTRTVTDATRKVGYREIRVTGQNGQKTVIYEIETRDGQETNRKIISEVIDTPAVEQVEVVGIKSSLDGVPPLTARMGAQTYWVGPILRKETWYDLPMSVVMRNCGQGGYYSVRADGVKIDRDGFVIIAANLNRYPRCSEVDTSLGRGKVYDTGGFAANNPEQFDIATDWTNHDGR